MSGGRSICAQASRAVVGSLGTAARAPLGGAELGEGPQELGSLPGPRLLQSWLLPPTATERAPTSFSGMPPACSSGLEEPGDSEPPGLGVPRPLRIRTCESSRAWGVAGLGSAQQRPRGWMAPRASGVSSTLAGTAWLAPLADPDAEPLWAQLASCSHLGCRRQSTHSLARKQPRCRQCRLGVRGLLHLQAEAGGRQGRAGTPSWCWTQVSFLGLCWSPWVAHAP